MRAIGIIFDKGTYLTLFNAYSKRQMADQIEALLQEATSLNILSRDMCNMALEAFGRVGQLDKMLVLYAKMRESNRTCPDEISYINLIDQCSINGRIDLAEQFWKDMTELDKLI